MKIACLMWYDSDIKEYADINYKINKIYCENQGIDLIVSSEQFYQDGRTKHWEKIPMILKELEIGYYDYVIWIDADAHFYVDSPCISDLIQEYNDKCFIFSYNFPRNIIHTWEINGGVFIVKNCSESIELLNTWSDGYINGHNFNNGKMNNTTDQSALWYMLKENCLNICDKSVCLPYGFLQHFSVWKKELYLKNTYHNYGHPFVIHYSEKDIQTRAKGSRDYYMSLSR